MLNILVVDDDEDIRTLWVTVLEQAGFTAQQAGDGREALELIERQKPELIVLDLMMPEISGLEVCRRIRDNPLLRDIIVFIVTARDDLDTKLSCFAMGANEYLVKPVDPRELEARALRFLLMKDQWKTPPLRDVVEPKKILQESHTYSTTVGLFPSLRAEIPSRAKYGVYTVESLVGKGGMGNVYKAYDEHLARHVAVKVLSPEFSETSESVKRFHREAKLLASIDHSGIASIYALGEEQGEHFFAMQWCSGGSLDDLINRRVRIEIHLAIDILLQCARALSAAYAKGVIHRDIKPGNIMMDENQQVRVVDFGLAIMQTMSSNITRKGQIVGTPNFMAPEQSQGRGIDHRADIYSLGITLYKMLYGKLPFTASSPVEMILKHCVEPLPCYDDLGGAIPEAAYRIIEKMTRKEPSDRYSDYSGLIKDLEELRKQLLSQSQLKVPRAVRLASGAAIQSTNLFKLLAALYRHQESGVLKVNGEVSEKSFLIRQREVVFCESPQQEKSVWNRLLEREVLKKVDIPAEQEDLQQSLNRLLLEQLLTLKDFKTTYREVMKSALMEMFLRPGFVGEFRHGDVENEAFCAIPIVDILLEAARSNLDHKTVSEYVPPNQPLSPNSHFRQIVYSLNLKPEESFLASRLEEGRTTIEMLHLLTGLPLEQICLFVYLLKEIEAVEFSQSKPNRIETPLAASEAPIRAEASSARTPPASDNLPEPTSQPTSAASISESTLTPESSSKRVDKVRMDIVKSEKQIEEERELKVANQFYHLAEQKLEEGKYWEATRLCSEGVKHNKEARFYHLMARAYSKHARFGKEAEHFFSTAIKMDPWNADYYTDLAEFYFEQGLYLRSSKECRAALEIAPQDLKAKELVRKLESTKGK